MVIGACCPGSAAGDKQAGFSILSLLFVGAGLIAALAFLLAGLGPNVSAQVSNQKSVQLQAQAQLIVHRIGKCAADYPAGDNGSGVHKPYPAGAGGAVSDLICPGSGQNLWSGNDGVYLPSPPAGFSGWTYSNALPAVIEISSVQPGAQSAVLATAATRLGSVASATADTLTIKVIE